MTPMRGPLAGSPNLDDKPASEDNRSAHAADRQQKNPDGGSCTIAGVAESADARDSKSRPGNRVRVRVPPPAINGAKTTSIPGNQKREQP